NDPYLKERVDSLRNFGIRDTDNVMEPGTNGKLNEVQAAVGLLLLKEIDVEIEKRKEITKQYRQLLGSVPGITVSKDMDGVTHNYPYFVIRIDKAEYGLSRDEVFEKLKEYNVISRRYFYPLCSNFQCYRDIPSASASRLPVANKIADTVLCLPLHGRMNADDVESICDIIKGIMP
ncbi:MAG: DegT/DnrJ/EryC1/StrS family aminotransferase, partial [Ruminiclostridium sp.]